MAKIKGSIILESLIILGLISSLTPLLYKHISNRRIDLEAINEANTFLLLKNKLKDYLNIYQDDIDIGTLVLIPEDINIDIFGYLIGIRKEADGKITAMIAQTLGRNDMYAAKVASLLGVSAGIYSLSDTEKAWGINGLWAEKISDYGFSGLPPGITVLNTAYEQEDIFASVDISEFINSLETTELNKIQAKEICLNNDCITEWGNVSDTPIQIIIKCNNGDIKACRRAYVSGKMNLNCRNIGQTFKNNGGVASSGSFTFSLSETEYSTNQKCYFLDGEEISPSIVISNCNAARDINNKYCRFGFEQGITTSCENINSYAAETIGKYAIITSANSVSGRYCGFVPGSAMYLSNGSSYEVTSFCQGTYRIEVAGSAGSLCSGSNAYNISSGLGGKIVASLTLRAGNVVTASFPAGKNSAGSGAAFWVNGTVKAAAGGGGGCAGAGGYQGGCWTIADSSGYGNGIVSGCAKPSSGAGGSFGGYTAKSTGTRVTGYGGSGYCSYASCQSNFAVNSGGGYVKITCN